MKFVFAVLVLAAASRLSAGDVPADGPLRSAIDAYDHYQARETLHLLDALPRAERTGMGALHYRGLALGRLGRWGEAVKSLEHASAHAPADVGILLDLAQAEGNVARAAGPFTAIFDAHRVLKTLERAAAVAPTNPNVHFGLFRFYIQAPPFVGGSREKALAEVAEIERLDPLAAKLTRAELAISDRDPAAAFALYQEAETSWPGDFRAFFEFGKLAARTGQHLPEGLESLRRCLGFTGFPKGPDLPAVHLQIGDILRREGDHAGAQAAYRESLALDPDYEAAKVRLAAP